MSGAPHERDDSQASSAALRLQAIIDSFADRCRRGEAPTIAEYAAAHPELAGRIEEALGAIRFLDGSGAGASKQGETDAVGSAPAPGAAASFPRQLGEFRLVREIGRGGMGVVFEAEQATLRRKVALKLLPSDPLMDPRRLERFEREARAAASLRHPGIVPVFSMGSQDGIHYFAMEYIEGRSLDKVLLELRRLGGKDAPDPSGQPASSSGAAGGSSDSSSLSIALRLLSDTFDAPPLEGAANASSMPVRRDRPAAPALVRTPRDYFRGVARVVGQAAEALAHAHARGVIHRDVKPSNILVELSGRAWLADFGLARPVDAGDLTRSGEVLGTLRYMAPEQLRGSPEARSDIYGLGLTLYELCTLEPAFPDRDREQLLRSLVAASPRLPRQVQPAIPRDLESIVRKAIQRDPALRYQSAREMAEDLSRWSLALPVRARLPGATARIGRFLLRHVAAAVISTLILAMLGSYLALILSAHHPRGLEYVIARDVDGDGKLELMTANGASASVSLLGNMGQTVLAVRNHYAVDRTPVALASADLDGDGDLDLVASCLRAGLSILRNNGGGAFEPQERLAVAGAPARLQAQDFDGDGDFDLMATTGTGSLSFLRNRGRGQFDPPVIQETVADPCGLTSVDLEGDGDQDLLVASLADSATRNVAVLTNAGDGTFPASRTLDLGSKVWEIAAADFDGDGRLDAAVTFDRNHYVGLLWSSGAAHFDTPAKVPVRSLLVFIAPGDVDGDGDQDLVACGSGSFATVLRNDGGRSFVVASELTTGLRPLCVALGDLDGDADLDLVTANNESADLSVFVNDGKGGFGAERRDPLSWKWGLRGLSGR